MGQVHEKDSQSFSAFPTPCKGIVSPPPLQKPQSHPRPPCVSPYFCFPFPCHFACPLESLLRLSIFITRITQSFSSVNNSEPSLAPQLSKLFTGSSPLSFPTSTLLGTRTIWWGKGGQLVTSLREMQWGRGRECSLPKG